MRSFNLDHPSHLFTFETNPKRSISVWFVCCWIVVVWIFVACSGDGMDYSIRNWNSLDNKSCSKMDTRMDNHIHSIPVDLDVRPAALPMSRPNWSALGCSLPFHLQLLFLAMDSPLYTPKWWPQINRQISKIPSFTNSTGATNGYKRFNSLNSTSLLLKFRKK